MIPRILSWLLPLVLASPAALRALPEAPPTRRPVASVTSVTSTRGVDRAPPGLAAEIDRFFAREMAKYHVPGSVFLYVEDRQVVLTRGYGIEDFERRRPVTPDRSIFRVASISKLLTATAVMILVDRGLVSPGEDINRYLKSTQVRPGPGGPVTVASVLTHTAGFDERFIGLHVRERHQVTPLGPFLQDQMPPRIRPPGMLYSYSNHGSALLGLLVEDVSGLSFEDFMVKEIFRPLGMSRSSFLLDPWVRELIVTAYDQVDTGRPRPVPLTHANVGPAGGLNSTADDIGRFMRMHLGRGQLDERRILSDGTVEAMHRRQFTHDPRIPGFSLGFAEVQRRGLRALRHTGFAPGYVSLFLIEPVRGWGFFVSSSTVGAHVMHDDLQRLLIDRHAGGPAVDAPYRPTGRELAAVVGSYRLVRRPRNTFDLLPVLHSSFVPEMQVRFREDGGLVLSGHNGPPARLAPVGSRLFRRSDDESLVAFGEGPEGDLRHLFMEHSTGPGAYERCNGLDHRAGRWLVLVIFVTFYVVTIFRHERSLRRPGLAPDVRAGHRRGMAAALLSLAVPGGQILALFPLEGGFPQQTYGVPPIVVVLHGAALILLWLILYRWRNENARLEGLVGLAFLVFLERYNWVGFRF